MARAPAQSYLTAADHLDWEQTQVERHEYIDGEVFAMAGAEDAHVTVVVNLTAALHRHVRGTPCKTYVSDMRLHVAAFASTLLDIRGRLPSQALAAVTL